MCSAGEMYISSFVRIICNYISMNAGISRIS